MQPTPLQINKPCHENWGAMTPNERGRHCASCDKTVVDLTVMPAVEARAFMNDLGDKLRSKSGEHVCVRAHADTSGRLMKPGARRLLLTNGLAAILAMSMAGCGDHSSSTGAPTKTGVTGAHHVMGSPVATPQPRELMGDVCEPPEPAPVQPLPEMVMGLIAPPPPAIPVEMGEVEAVPQPAAVVEPRELMGKVVAPQPDLPVIKGEVHIPEPAAKE
jgi:hypothetical protein